MKRKFLSIFPAVVAVFLLFRIPGGLNAENRGLPKDPPSLRYEIWVELIPARRTLLGRETISWKNTSQDDVPDMRFHLYFNAFRNDESSFMQESPDVSYFFDSLKLDDRRRGRIDVRSISLEDGTDLKPSAEFMTDDIPRHPGDRTVMRVVFPRPVKSGETVTIRIEFESVIPQAGVRTGAYGKGFFVSQWFPKPGVYENGKGWNCHEYHRFSEFFSDFADFTVHITVPEGFVIGACGKLGKTSVDASRKTVTETYGQRWIHDFAWTAGRDFLRIERDFIGDRDVTAGERARAAAGLGIPPEELRLPDVRMILLIEKQHRRQIDRHFRALKEAIKFYGLWYGPYPYETVTMIDPPFRTGSGGMEYPTLFTAGTSRFIGRRDLSLEGVIIHEFGHGYWYGLVANNEFEEAWLDEGINTYATGKAVSSAFGRGEIALAILGIPLNKILKTPLFLDWEADRLLAIGAATSDPVVKKSWEFQTYESYSANVYMRAATCLNTMEGLLGHDIMARVLREFQTRFRFRHPSTRDFTAVVSETSGKNLDWFFKEFFFDTLDFDYGISTVRSEEIPLDRSRRKGKTVNSGKTLFRTTVYLERHGEARVGGGFPVELRIVFEDGREVKDTWDGQGRWIRLTYESASRARFAEIDPGRIWTLDSHFANNSYSLEPSRSGTLRMASKILFVVQNILLLFSSIA